ncbi:phage head spike fiber domain-containing protein [Aeromonas hydrophila]|uniref:phage head spike fiber domain-containing protein n=1 Tax=Aeromonas hydrophila TaxID=644 RepID=UPI00244200E7|nr:hypothetical protein [Aeromonas hydrophila]
MWLLPRSPLPDVWVPLSDSLRLITGYGRDVLVGSDVVARMVNFSRSTTATYIGKDGQLKTAAANEPRFEKEGLLIEGQSTNYIPKSEYYSDYVKSNLTVSGKVLTRSVTTGESYLNIGSYNLPTGKVTISAAYKKSSAVNFDYFNVYCERFTPKAANLVKVKELDDIVIVSATVDADFSVGAAGVFFKTLMVGNGAGSVQLEYFQMEALPFASSYIPTTGAAATRAADQAWLPAAGNRFIGGLYAAAFEFDLLGRVVSGVSEFSRLVDFDNSGGSDRQHISLTVGGQLQCLMGPSQAIASVAGKLAGRAAMRMNNLTMNVMMDGVAGSSVTASGIGSSLNNRIVLMNSNLFNLPSYGHIRNLRMWSKHPISNDQLRTAA